MIDVLPTELSPIITHLILLLKELVFLELAIFTS